MKTPATPCKPCHGFNYCFWSKLLVAIVLFPMLALFAASAFTLWWSQALAAGGVIGFTVWLAVVIDRLPGLQGMVVTRGHAPRE